MLELILAGVLFVLFPIHFGFLFFLSFRKKLQSSKTFLPSVSILIPALNEEKVIGNTLEALLKCDYPRNKMEIIVIASGSTDRTVEICKNYSSKGPIKVLTKPLKKRGKPAALNLGLASAKNDVIVIYDADSIVQPPSLRALVEPLGRPGVAAAVGPVGMINDDVNVLTRSTSLEFAWLFESSELRQRLGLLMPFSGSNRCVKKDVLKRLGGFDEDSLVEELDLEVRLSERGSPTVFSPDAMVYEEAITSWKVHSGQRERWITGTRMGIRKFMPKTKTRIKLGFLFSIFHAMLPIWLISSLVSFPIFLAIQAHLFAACSALTFCFTWGLLIKSVRKYGKKRYRYLLYLPVWAAIALHTTLTKPFKRATSWKKTQKEGWKSAS